MKTLAIVILFSFVTLPAFAVFSVDLPIVTHAVGASATFYTSMDITNNTAQPTGVNFEYVSSDLSVDVSGTLVAALGPRGNFHTDDVLGTLASQGAITSAQATNGFGTLLISFNNPSFTTGTEASVTVRVYNYLNLVRNHRSVWRIAESSCGRTGRTRSPRSSATPRRSRGTPLSLDESRSGKRRDQRRRDRRRHACHAPIGLLRSGHRHSGRPQPTVTLGPARSRSSMTSGRATRCLQDRRRFSSPSRKPQGRRRFAVTCP